MPELRVNRFTTEDLLGCQMVQAQHSRLKRLRLAQSTRMRDRLSATVRKILSIASVLLVLLCLWQLQ